MTGTDSSQTGPRLVAGRYRLTEVLGRGGMGVVWQAADELIGRTVAVKELRVPHGLSERERAAFGERALREARTAGRIHHPGVIAIHDLIPDMAQDSVVYVVMEFVEAPSLAAVLEQDGALPERRVARLGVRLLEALDAAHAIGLVHRDVKPSNILVLADDQVKLVDFGIAHAVDDTRLTRTGVAGSTGYIAPELFEGESPTPAVDLWSLGVTLHHAATGRSPFERGSTAATIRAVLHDNPPPLDRHPSLAPVIEGLLVRDPTQRMDGREAAEGLRDAIASDRDTAAAPVRQNPRPGEPAGRPSTWQNRPTGVHTRPTGTGGPRARANAARRDTDSRALGHRGPADELGAVLRRPEAQVSNGGRRAATWEDQPTSVRNTAPLSRSMARSGPAGQTSTTATDGDPERCTVFPAKAARQLDNWTFVVLCGLVVWIGWRLLQILGLEGFVPILPLILGALIAASATLTPPWCFSLGAEGISLSRLSRPGRKTVPNSNIAVAWEHIDEVVLVRRRHTSRAGRTAITLHMAATTPADVRSKPPLRSVDRTRGRSGFAWSMGEVNQPVDELNVAFRAAAPLHTPVRTPSDPDAEDLRYHGPRRTWSAVASLLLAGILVATYAFHHHGDSPVRLSNSGWEGAVEFSPDGATLASSSTDHTIRLWDVGARKNTGVLSGYTGDISAMRFTSDGSLLAAAVDDIDEHTIRVWDVSTHTERRTLTVGEDTSTVSLAFSPGTHTLASVNDEGTIAVWDVRSGQKTATIRENTSDAFPVKFGATFLFLGGLDSSNRPHRWDVVTGRRASTAADDGLWAIASGSVVYIRDGSGSAKRMLIDHDGKITDLTWAGDPAETNAAGLLATASEDHTIRVWHIDTGTMARKLTLDRENGSTADAVALSPDGKTLVYGSDTALWIWETGIDT